MALPIASAFVHSAAPAHLAYRWLDICGHRRRECIYTVTNDWIAALIASEYDTHRATA